MYSVIGYIFMSLSFRYLLRALMKKPYLVLLTLTMSILSANSQSNVIKLQSCNDQLIAHQVDSLKKLYTDDGFLLLKEASITMESEFEMPVIIPLTQGSRYQFIFINRFQNIIQSIVAYCLYRIFIISSGKDHFKVSIGTSLKHIKAAHTRHFNI